MSARQNRNLLETHHLVSLNQLSSIPQSLTAHAFTLGITVTEASHRLSILVDEGLAVQLKNLRGAPTGFYQLA